MEGEGLSIPSILMVVGALAFFAHIFQYGFEKYKIPDTLWLIGIGLVLGPLTGWVKPGDFGIMGQVLTTIALAVILFEAGVDLKLEDLRAGWRGALLLTLVAYGVTFVAVSAVIYYVVKMPFEAAIFGGAVIAAPSPPVIIPLLRKLPFASDIKAVATLESAIGEALGLVIALAILKAAQVGDMSLRPLLSAVVGSFIVAGVLGVAAGIAWSYVLNKTRALHNAMILTPATVFMVFGFCDFLGFSGPIAALCFGFVLGSFRLIMRNMAAALPSAIQSSEPARYNQGEMLFLGEMVFILKTFFFVFLGLNMRESDLWSPHALAIVGVMLLTRFASVFACLRRLAPKGREATALAVMMPKGLAAAVMASAASHARHFPAGNEIDNVIYSVILYSIVGTAVLIFLNEKCGLHRLFAWMLPTPRSQDSPSSEAS